LDEIKNSFTSKNEDSEDKEDYLTLIKEIKEIDVLLLDDFGVERNSEWVNEIFYSIINDRMTSRKITLFTSNYKMEELPYDSRIINRLIKKATPIEFPDESIRLRLAMEENEEFINLLLRP
ncbi:MAG: ATP-binding protein, partial [Anaerotignaceae bacterium]